jgi:hypothetical protein
MPYNPELHHRRSIRLKGYDYSQEGLYFITICVQDGESLFGEIVVGASLRGCPESDNNGCTESDINGFPESDNNGCPESDINGSPESNINGCKQMILNDAGKMVERWYRELENKYPDKRCHEMVIMPNHFHCIIENLGTGSHTDCGSQTDGGLQLDGGSNLGAQSMNVGNQSSMVKMDNQSTTTTIHSLTKMDNQSFMKMDFQQSIKMVIQSITNAVNKTINGGNRTMKNMDFTIKNTMSPLVLWWIGSKQ